MPNWTLYEGDCLEVMRQLPDNSVDAVVTDPPYGIDLKPPRGRTKPIVGDRKAEAQALWREFVPQCYRLLKPNTAALFFAGWSEAWVPQLLAEWFTVKACIVWRKNVWGIGYYTRPQHEFIWYCHKGKPPVPDRAESDVWDAPRVPRPKHACEKPVALMRRAVRFVSPVGGTILDPFAGVGSTLVAAIEEGRNVIAVEIEPEYCEIIRKRMAELQPALPLVR